MKSKFAPLRLAALVAVACTVSTAFAADQYLQYQRLTLTWTPPTRNLDGSPLTDLVGYYVYSGETPEVMQIQYFASTARIVVGYWGTRAHYFGVSAVNVEGWESDLTNVVVHDVID
jgi:hypothetical protein